MTDVTSGQVFHVTSGNTDVGDTIEPGGIEFVDVGGVASGTAISGAFTPSLHLGIQAVYGSALDTTITSGGAQIIFDGGVSSETTIIGSGGQLISGGTAFATTLSLGGVQSVVEGSASGTTVLDSGVQILGGGNGLPPTGSAFAAVISSGGSQVVSSGGTAFGTTVSTGGGETVGSGGAASGTTLTGVPGSFQTVAIETVSGGSVFSTTILEGGLQYVEAGGSSTDTVMLGVGGQRVIAGGTAFNTTVSSGSNQYVGVGGVASTTTVVGAAQQTVSGGMAFGTTISFGASELIGGGGTDSGSTVSSGGIQTVSSDGTATGTVVSAGGNQTVFTDGVTSGTTLTGIPGSFQTVAFQVVDGGTASGTTILEGGQQYVESAGLATGTTLIGVGGQRVISGGSAFQTTVSSGADQYVGGGGLASTTTVIGIAQQTVSGGTAFATTLSSGGKQFVAGGGTASGTQITSGGAETVASGGVAVGTTISTGGVQAIYADGSASGTEVAGNTGSLFTYGFQVLSGGSAFDTTLDSGGAQIIHTGSASGTAINAGGTQVLSGGTAFATTVSTGGIEEVLGTGVASSTVVSGGLLIVANGGVADAPVLSGGTAEFLSGGVDSGGLTFAAGGSMLTLDPNAVVHGTVAATGSTDNLLDLLAGDGSIGTIAGIGTQFTGFNEIVIDPNATWDLSGTTTIDSGVTIANSGTITETGSDNLTINGPLTGYGVVDLDPTTTTLNGAVGGITFNLLGTGDTLQLGDPTEFGGTIDGLATNGGTLDLTGYTVTDASIDQGNGTLTLTTGSGPITLHLGDPGSFNGEFFHFASDGGTGTSITVSTACYCPGTLIRTERGDVAVEDLQIGDRLVTVSGALAPIQWIGRRSYAGRFLAGQKHILPIRIRAGALGEQVPARDLWISPQHAMYLDGVLVEAKELVNGVSVVQENVERVDYIHVELEAHDVIWAEGAASETFIDDDSRGMFQNADEFARLYPGRSWKPAEYCAPRLNEGYVVEAIRQRLAERATIPQTADSTAALRGFVDLAGPEEVLGWAQDPASPEMPVRLDVLVDGRLVGQVLANQHRQDLQDAGLGSGRHAFVFLLPAGSSGQVEVCRTSDQQRLPSSEGERRAA